MRNFLKNPFAKKQVLVDELLDTDEDKVMNQYKRYLQYINRVKKELIRKSAELVGYRQERRMETQ